MKETGERWFLRNDHQLNAFVEHVHARRKEGKKTTVQFLEDDRTASQNALFHALYRKIANQSQDKSMLQVKAECKLRFGVVIRKGADPEWSDWYDRAIKNAMSYEDKLLLMEDFPITSNFTKEQGTEYLNSIIQAYIAQGYDLETQDLQGVS